MANSRSALLASIASTIADYRVGEIPTPDAAHVDRWVNQFDPAVQDSILLEMDHVLKKTYIKRTDVEGFLAGLVKNANVAGSKPCDFWKNANFLDIQRAGNSQREMLKLFEQSLQAACGTALKQCGAQGGPYIYLDDGVFTGNRVRSDLIDWVQTSAPAKAEIHIIVLAHHLGGQHYAKTGIENASRSASKTLRVEWWTCLEIEDRKAHTDNSDVLRPSSIPNDALTLAYVKGLKKHPPVMRRGTSVGPNGFFSSHAGRSLLEQELLKAGVKIRKLCPNLNSYQRPLGNIVLELLGFGSLVVTFRNCPNNAPLALWAGQPWYPLFPRKTN